MVSPIFYTILQKNRRKMPTKIYKEPVKYKGRWEKKEYKDPELSSTLEKIISVLCLTI